MKRLWLILPVLLIVGCLKTPPSEQITNIYQNVLVALLIGWTITLKKGAVVFSMKKLNKDISGKDWSIILYPISIVLSLFLTFLTAPLFMFLLGLLFR